MRMLIGGNVLSGESIARELGISRAAVWKAIKGLVADGYCISSVKGQGYRLECEDLLCYESVRALLPRSLDCELDIYMLGVTDSTNTRAKRHAETSTDRRKCLFIADGQTDGRGRRGRSFDSERGVGLYMSLLIYPDRELRDCVGITAYAAVAVCRAIERLTDARPCIKWVNDIYLNNKKIAGILTEGSVDMESGGVAYAIVGIGINVKQRDFGALSDIAASLAECGYRVDRASLAAAVTEELMSGLDSVGTREIADEYRRRSFIVGKEVRVIKLSGEYTATVLDITDGCELRLRLCDGSEELLMSGEVSLKI